MTTRSFRQALTGVSLALLALAGAAPALAASDASLLQSYVGNYLGTGTIEADPPQPIDCRLTAQAPASGRLAYTGRCSAGGVSFSMAGVITVSNGKFSASMSGSGGGVSGAGTVVGSRRGNGVVFSSRSHDTSMGHDRSIASSFTLANGGLRLDFTMRDNKTGKTTAGSIPFSKAH